MFGITILNVTTGTVLRNGRVNETWQAILHAVHRSLAMLCRPGGRNSVHLRGQ